MLKLNLKMSKEKWLILLCAGVLLLIITLPSGKSQPVAGKEKAVELPDSISAAAPASRSYEEELEQRVKQILKNVEGVGSVDVMIVLKSSEEKVLRVDKNTSNSSTQEQDTSGGTRTITSDELQESTILTGNGSDNAPIIEKELKPEIAGIVISAAGGGSATVKAEITGAMEALFDVPPHKIKVLKRIG